MPAVIFHAPQENIGLSVETIWNDQGIDHVATLLRHGTAAERNITGCLLRSTLANLKMELGLPENHTAYEYK